MDSIPPRAILRELTADDINWSLAPAPPPAVRDSLADLLVDAIVEAQSYRMLAQEALHEIRRLTIANDRARDRAQQRTDEIARLEADNSRLRMALLQQDGVTA